MTDNLKLSSYIMKDKQEETFRLYQEDIQVSLGYYSKIKAVSVGLKKGEWKLRKHLQQGNQGDL